MRDQMLAAFNKAGVEPPPADEVNPSSPELIQAAEKFYNNTEILPASKMERAFDVNMDRRVQDLVWDKLGPLLGIEEIDIVRARAGEQVRLLSELRSHDALANMILKIGVCAGIISETEAKAPNSTIRALAIGQALQNIYSKMNQTVLKVLDDTDNEKSKVASREELIVKLTNDLALQRAINLQRNGPLDRAREAIGGTEAGFFMIVGDMKADKNSTDHTPIKQIGYLTAAYPDDKKLTRYALRPFIDPENIRKFESIEKARMLIEKLLRTDGKHRFPRDQVCSFRIGRQIIEHWGS